MKNQNLTGNRGKNWSPLKGSGKVRPNSAKDGSGQGVGSPKRIIECRVCRFPYDKTRYEKCPFCGAPIDSE